MRFTIIGLIVALLFSTPAWGITITVNSNGSGDYPTIQAAIDAANPGDVIELVAGVFTGPGNRDIDFSGKAITIQSQNGVPASCVIDCERESRGFLFQAGEGSGSVLQGITIANGFLDGATGGAGIFIFASSPEIKNNIIKGNSSDTIGGGGIYCYNSSALIQGNIIIDNTAGHIGSDRKGGGLLCVNSIVSTVTIRDNTFYGNFASDGHAIYVNGTDLAVENTIIQAGSVQTLGIESGSGSTVTLSCCNIYGNPAGSWTGDIADQLGLDGNISVDPRFCDPDGDVFTLASNSPCAAENNPGCGQIGAQGTGCVPIQLTFDILADGSGDFPTIQPAIDGVLSGDIIELDTAVFSGVGNVDLRFYGKALTLRSVAIGSEETIIACSGDEWDEEAAMNFTDGEGPETIIQGIVIRGGWQGQGGAISCYGSSPTFTDMIFTQNGSGQGGALYCDDGAAPSFTNCYFNRNSAQSLGGGFYCGDGAAPTLVNCYFNQNTASSHGGGLYCQGGSAPQLTDCNFNSNTASGQGGGVGVYGTSTPTFSDCEFNDNTSTDDGGGLYASQSTPSIENCSFMGNQSGDKGGALYFFSSDNILITGCLFNGNSSNSFGGGINFHDTNADLSSCTIYGNSSSPGSGVSIRGGSNVNLTNLLVASNLGGEGVFLDGSTSTSNLTCCDIHGNAGGDWTGDIADQLNFNNNISADPRFCDPAGDDLTLAANSPCAAANNPGCGQIGSMGGGCEAINLTFEIFADGSGDFPTIQAAIDAAQPGDIIELADGTFTGAGNRDIDFGGKDLTLQSQSGDPTLCIIDCQATLGDTHRGFYFHQEETSASILQDVTIINGFHDYGGGIACSNSSPQFVNVVVADCESPLSGGGLYITQGSTTQMTGCEVRDNVSGSKGGAICVHLASPVLDDCQFSENHAADDGGAIYCNEDLTVTNSHFEGNTSIGDGGGINFSGDECEISNCTLIDNMALHEGGGIYCRDSAPLISNCLFEGNDGVQSAGGIKCDTGADPNILDCTFIANTTDNLGGAIGLENSNPIITGCTMYGNSAINGGNGLRLYNSSPVLTGNVIAFGTAGEAVTCGGSNSPTIHCTDIYGNAGGDWVDCLTAFAGLAGNISADPLFCDAAGGDFTLASDSPCSDEVSGCGQIGAFGVGCTSVPTYLLVNASGTGDEPTIQAAIDAIADGGVVELADGTYTGPGNRDLSLGGKVLTIRSQSGDPASCIIDCQGSETENHRGLTIDGGQGLDMLVENLTFTNAWRNGGGGIRIAIDSDPTIQGCIFLDNTSSDGGGIFVTTGSNPTITDCHFEGNSVSNAGGGLRFSLSGGEVVGCTFRGNYGYWGGGGIYLYDSGPSIDDCLFDSNSCHDMGSDMTVHLAGSSTMITDCTFHGSDAPDASIYVRTDAAPSFVNCLIAFNVGGAGVECDGGTVTMTCCDIYGNADGDWTGCITSQLGSDGNISADPLFCDAAGGNFTLNEGSPCSADESACGRIGAFGVACYLPLSPADLIAEAYSSSEISLSWSDLSDEETSFNIYRSLTEEGVYELCGDVAADQTSYISSGLEADTEYWHHVRSVNINGESPPCVPAMASTDGTPVYLSLFELTAEPGRVLTEWQIEELLDPGSFRLTVSDTELSWNLDVSENETGGFRAVDQSVRLTAGGEFTYSLFAQMIGEEWVLLRSATVELDAVPLVTELVGAWPNPFNPHTSIRFSLETSGHARLAIYDLSGRRIKVLHDGVLDAAVHEKIWRGKTNSGDRAASGVYFVRLDVEGRRSFTQKLVMIR